MPKFLKKRKEGRGALTLPPEYWVETIRGKKYTGDRAKEITPETVASEESGMVDPRSSRGGIDKEFAQD